jgi:hypothetical protein
MSNKIILLPAILVSALFASCSKESALSQGQEVGIVAFEGTGISIEPGSGWKKIESTPGPPVCAPTLVGSAGIIRGLLFAPGRSDVKSAAAGLRAAFESNPTSVKESYREEEVVTQNGEHVLHVSYVDKSEKEGKTTESHSHNYILTIHASRCVSVSYIATAGSDSEGVHQMIRKTLKVQ